jgi:MscS family membrane protein
VIVPNKTIVSTNIVNWSRLTKRRLDMTLGLTSKSSVEQVLSVVQAVREMLQTHPQVQSDSVIVHFSEFGEHALNVRIVCFMKTPAWNDFQATRQDINLKIMQIMEQHGVEFGSATFEVLLGKVATPSPQSARLAPQPEPAISTTTDSPVPDDAAN